MTEQNSCTVSSSGIERSRVLAEIAGPFKIDALDSPASPAIDLSLIVPTYNEAHNIGALLKEIVAALDAAGCRGEIIVVDDDSPDRTWALAEALIESYPSLRVMRRRSERGLSSAVVRGWQAARGEVLAVIDGDLQHPPRMLIALYHAIQKGADLAVASRNVEGGGVSEWSVLRRIISRTAQLVGLLILPGVVGRVTDPMSGYFMVRRSALQGVLLHPLGYKVLLEVLARGRIRVIAEVPYLFRERLRGKSKLTARVYMDYWRHLVRLRIASLRSGRFLRFALVGLSGVILDMAMLFLLSDPSMLGWGLTRSKLLGSELAIVNNFIWNDNWTFRDLARRQPTLAQRFRRFAKFQAICLAGLALNALLLNFQFNVLGVNRYLANAIAIALVTGWNYWLNLKLSWQAAGS